MKKFLKIAALSMSAAMLFAGCDIPNKDMDIKAEKAEISVYTQTAAKGKIQKKNDFMGRVMPDSTVFVIPKVQGEIIKINAAVGQEVEKGQVLFEIDSTIDKLQLEQAAAAVEIAKAGLQQATGATYEQQLLQLEGQLSSAESQKKWTNKTYNDYDDIMDGTSKLLLQRRNAAEANMQKKKKAYEDLKADTSATDEQKEAAFEEYNNAKDMYQEAVYAYENSHAGYEAQYNQLTQGLEQVEIGLDVAKKAYDLATGDAHKEQLKTIEAQLSQAQTAYKMAMQKLSYSSVTSPIKGVIEKKNIELHGFASQSEPAFVITEKSAINVTFGVSGENARNMKVGDIVKVMAGDKEYDAPIVEVSAFIDTQSGLYTIKAQVTGEAPELMSGSSVKLSAITNQSKDSIVIDASAVYNENNESFLYISDNGTAKKVVVKTGIVTDKEAEILEGLNVGDIVITTWNPGLIDGAPVVIKEEV